LTIGAEQICKATIRLLVLGDHLGAIVFGDGLLIRHSEVHQVVSLLLRLIQWQEVGAVHYIGENHIQVLALRVAGPFSRFEVRAHHLQHMFLGHFTRQELAKVHLLQCGGHCLREDLPENLKACIFQFVKRVGKHFENFALIGALLRKVKKSLLLKPISIKKALDLIFWKLGVEVFKFAEYQGGQLLIFALEIVQVLQGEQKVCKALLDFLWHIRGHLFENHASALSFGRQICSHLEEHKIVNRFFFQAHR
jgi:hypothetical protein